MDNMDNIFSKKDFLSLMMRDRLPVARLELVLGKSEGGWVEFYSSPLGTVLLAKLGENSTLRAIKLYDRVRGRFVSKNVFCGDGITDMGDGTYICISCALQIEDVIGREFLIKTNDDSIVARAELLPRPQRRLDKLSQLVYN